jgi:hypothetical protein
MSHITSIVLALASVGFLPSGASADVPNVGQPESANRERARLRWAITRVRAMLDQVKDRRGCAIPEEVRAAERLLEYMEWAYVHDMPSLIRLPRPAR